MTRVSHIALWVVVGIVVLSGAALLLRGNEDTWFCQDGAWVAHGKPSAAMPDDPCPLPGGQGTTDPRITVATPVANSLVTSPLSITGTARGTWYFEASFPVQLLDASGTVIAEHYASAQGEWMTENFVPFSDTLVFTPQTPGTTGTLVLKRDNPSGLPENDAEVRIPVRF